MATHHHHHPHVAKPQPPKHTDEQLGPELAKIINHPYVVAHKDDEGGPSLWDIRLHHHDADDHKRIMTEALAHPNTPGDLRELIILHLLKQGSLPELVPKEEAQRHYSDHSNFMVSSLQHTLQGMLDTGWPLEDIAAQVLCFIDAKLNPEFVAKTEERMAELEELGDGEDEEEDEDDDFDDEDEDDAEEVGRDGQFADQELESPICPAAQRRR
jgi:hypothetical protein